MLVLGAEAVNAKHLKCRCTNAQVLDNTHLSCTVITTGASIITHASIDAHT